MFQGAIFAVRQDGDSWVLTALDFDTIPSAVLNAGTVIGEYSTPNDMCRQITSHVESLSKSGSGSEQRQSGGGSEQRV